MNPWQMAQQIKHKLTTVAWTVGATDVVFGTRGVHVFAGRPTEEQIPAGFPWALVGIDGGNADPDHPEFINPDLQHIVGGRRCGRSHGRTSHNRRIGGESG